MAARANYGGKRELLAPALFWSGASFLLSHLRAQDSLLVLNCYRIGISDDDSFDPGVFSVTANQFNDQVAYLRRHDSPVTLGGCPGMAGLLSLSLRALTVLLFAGLMGTRD